MITLPEICTWLSSHQVEVIYNQVTDRIFFRTPHTSGVGGQSSDWLEMDEGALCTLRKEMAAETGKRILKSDVHDIIRSNYGRQIHPVRDYLNTLPAWDGKDRVRELTDHLTAVPVQEGQDSIQAQEELLWAFHKWLVRRCCGNRRRRIRTPRQVRNRVVMGRIWEGPPERVKAP